MEYDGTHQDRVYVIFGQALPWQDTSGHTGTEANPILLSTLAPSNAAPSMSGFYISNTNKGCGFGTDTIGTGDFNHDGYADIVARGTSTCVGSGKSKAYVIWGKATASWAASQEVGAMVTGGSATRFDFDVNESCAFVGGQKMGDVNGDGIDDLMLSAPCYVGAASSRHAYLIFGHTGAWSNWNVFTTPPDGTNGVQFDCVSGGYDGNNWYYCGRGMGAIDVNGDGTRDVILSDPWATASGHTHAGWVYVVPGKGSGWPADYSLSTISNAP